MRVKDVVAGDGERTVAVQAEGRVRPALRAEGALDRGRRAVAADPVRAGDDAESRRRRVGDGGEGRAAHLPAEREVAVVHGAERAVWAEVDIIVTGDRAHLLPRKHFRGIPIVTPREFVERSS